MTKFKSIALIALAGVFLQSCSNDDDGPNNDPENGNYSKGVFILNEGKFQAGNADITYYNPSTALGDKNPIQEIFKKANSRNLGDVAQDMVFKGNKAYVVVNNSNKVEIVDNTNFKSIATITDNILNPRYIVTDDKYFYVSNWGDSNNPNDDYVAIFNLSDNKFVNKIQVSEGPGHLLIDNNKLFVIYEESGRAGIIGNSMLIYDLTEKKNLYTIPVGDAPVGLVKSGDFVYILSQGMPDWAGTETGGKLSRVNVKNNYIYSELINFSKTEHPDFLALENDQLFYVLNKDVYSLATSNANFTPKKIFKSATASSIVYGLKVYNNNIYVLNAKQDFSSAGSLSIYNMSGALQEEITTGVGPNAVYIK